MNESRFLCLPLDLAVSASETHLLTSDLLAIAGLRSDLNQLTKSRAYSTFIARKLCEGNETEEPLFQETNYNFSVSDISLLTPIQLLLFQFHPKATQESCDQVAQRFFHLATSYQRSQRRKREMPKIEMRVVGCVLQEDDRKRIPRGELELLIMDAPARVVVLTDSDEFCELSSTSIQQILYLAGAKSSPHGTELQECTLILQAASSRDGGQDTSRSAPCKLTLDLGPLETHDPAFVSLRKTFREWSKSVGFPLGAEDAPTPLPLQRSPSPRAESTARKRSRSQSADSGYATSSRPRRSLSEPPLNPSWQYVDLQTYAETAWLPGFYARIAAFHHAVDMRSTLRLPSFTAEELVILSFRSNPALLPDVSHHQLLGPKFPIELRLAAERIYQHKHFIHHHSVRWILSSEGDPNLKAYVKLVAKIIECRDACQEAWRALSDRIESRLFDPKTKDPVRNILRIVDSLASSEGARLEYFGARKGRNRVTKTCNFTLEVIGAGPYRRYSEALEGCVAFETKAWDEWDLTVQEYDKKARLAGRNGNKGY